MYRAIRIGWCSLLAAAAIGSASLALADEHIGLTGAKKIAKAMGEDKVTLTDAIKVAEDSCKGKAVLAHGEIEKHNLVVAVFCVTADGKLMDIDVDAKTKKVTESKEIKAEAKGEKKSAEADEDITPAQATKLSKALDDAKTTLSALIKVAEDGNKSVAVMAKAHSAADKTTVMVYTLAGEKYAEVTVDPKTAKVTETKDIPSKEKTDKPKTDKPKSDKPDKPKTDKPDKPKK